VLVTVEAVDSESLPSPLPGDSVEISGLLRKPKGKNFSFEFDEAAWLASKGIFARLSVKAENFHIVAAQPTDCLDTREKVRGETALVRLNRAIDVVRKKIVVAHSEHLGGARGSLFSSMVLGDRVVSVDQELKQQFALIGLSHLLAASGLNLTIIVTAALVLCRFFQAKARPSQVARSGWLNIYVPFLCVVLFTAFAGAGPSVSRAAIMCLVALWARLAFVRLAHGAALALALLFALALDPVSVSDVGLQLSYGATFGIVYIYPLIESAWLEDIERVWLRAVFSLVAVVVAAQLAVLPIQLHVFQQLSVLVVPANLLAEPVVVPLTIMGFISSILAAVAACQLPQSFYFCQPLIDTAAVLCFAIDWLAKFPLDWLIYLARTLSLIPFVSLSVAKPQAAHIFLYYLLMALVLVGGRARPRIACLVLFITFAFLAAVSYVESPLLQLLCTERELIVNRGNLEYFVCPLNKQGQPFPSSRLGSQLGQSSHLGRLARLDQSERAQTAIGRSYVRYLLAKGIHIAPAPLVGEQLILEREALKIEIVGANFARSGLPCLQLITLPAPNSASGPYKLVCQPTRQGPVYCRLSGEVCSPLFIPYCSAPMPFAFPLIAEVEAVKSAYLVSLRL
jgi:ComEC/Rec2-related protein